MNVDAVEHLNMRNGLRQAVQRGEFVLHYQPQFDLKNGAIVGAEALIRWNHPQHGLVAPARFIPIAEESGLIVPIGEWVLRQACWQAAAWRKAGRTGMVVAVNLSAAQFTRGSLDKTIIGALEESGIDPSMLELELTESILIRDTEATLATVKRLKSLGLRLSIDDFGTGYSSLSYLKRFEVDKLKIDQSFIRDLAVDPEDAAIVRSIIQMAHSLGLRTIAEGVEHESLLHYLRIYHCDEAQGFHLGYPMPADDFADYLARDSSSAKGSPGMH
jgi:EAL domain-containing protein (putative c-di-GMP-specific phosphodiesterase class I)